MHFCVQNSLLTKCIHVTDFSKKTSLLEGESFVHLVRPRHFHWFHFTSKLVCSCKYVKMCHLCSYMNLFGRTWKHQTGCNFGCFLQAQCLDRGQGTGSFSNGFCFVYLFFIIINGTRGVRWNRNSNIIKDTSCVYWAPTPNAIAGVRRLPTPVGNKENRNNSTWQWNEKDKSCCPALIQRYEKKNNCLEIYSQLSSQLPRQNCN